MNFSFLACVLKTVFFFFSKYVHEWYNGCLLTKFTLSFYFWAIKRQQKRFEDNWHESINAKRQAVGKAPKPVSLSPLWMFCCSHIGFKFTHAHTCHCQTWQTATIKRLKTNSTLQNIYLYQSSAFSLGLFIPKQLNFQICLKNNVKPAD